MKLSRADKIELTCWLLLLLVMISISVAVLIHTMRYAARNADLANHGVLLRPGFKAQLRSSDQDEDPLDTPGQTARLARLREGMATEDHE